MAACDRRVGRVFEAHAGLTVGQVANLPTPGRLKTCPTRRRPSGHVPAWASKTRPTLRRLTERFTKEDAMTQKIAGPALILSALLAVGCSQTHVAPPTKSAAMTPAADGTKYVLAQEPADAKGVKDLRAAAKDGDDVVLVGRI